MFQLSVSFWDDWLTRYWDRYTQFLCLHSKMHIFALNLVLSLESEKNFDLLWPVHLLSSQGWLFPSIIRMVFSSEVFGVFVTTRYLVLFIWVDEIYSYFTQFSLIISSIPCLFLLYLSWYTIRTFNMTLYEYFSLSLSTRVCPYHTYSTCSHDIIKYDTWFYHFTSYIY